MHPRHKLPPPFPSRVWMNACILHIHNNKKIIKKETSFWVGLTENTGHLPYPPVWGHHQEGWAIHLYHHCLTTDKLLVTTSMVKKDGKMCLPSIRLHHREESLLPEVAEYCWSTRCSWPKGRVPVLGDTRLEDHRLLPFPTNLVRKHEHNPKKSGVVSQHPTVEQWFSDRFWLSNKGRSYNRDFQSSS